MGVEIQKLSDSADYFPFAIYALAPCLQIIAYDFLNPSYGVHGIHSKHYDRALGPPPRVSQGVSRSLVLHILGLAAVRCKQGLLHGKYSGVVWYTASFSC